MYNLSHPNKLKMEGTAEFNKLAAADPDRNPCGDDRFSFDALAVIAVLVTE